MEYFAENVHTHRHRSVKESQDWRQTATSLPFCAQTEAKEARKQMAAGFCTIFIAETWESWWIWYAQLPQRAPTSTSLPWRLELERRAEINSIDLNLFPQRFSSHWEERKLKHCLFINLLAFCFPKTRHRYLSSPVNQFLGSTVFLKKKFQVLSKEQECMPQNDVLSARNGLHWIKLLTKEDP